MTSFEIFRKYYKNRWDYKLVAQDWKENGGKIIGYPDINCPEEVNHCCRLPSPSHDR